ncbi:MAG: CBS domain-containing protein [Candidatus Planktophila sp.]|nr:CBS domain-containing protein [Candidatus Planktophila sp.]
MVTNWSLLRLILAVSRGSCHRPSAGAPLAGHPQRGEEITMKVSTLITGKRVETISSSATLHDLVNALNVHHVGALVVSPDGKKIDGIVSERDVVRAMPGKLDEITHMRVRDLMTAEVITCTPETTVADLMTVMTERRIRHVPVVDASGNLISIVSIGDVVKAHINELDAERKALSDYVNS